MAAQEGAGGWPGGWEEDREEGGGWEEDGEARWKIKRRWKEGAEDGEEEVEDGEKEEWEVGKEVENGERGWRRRRGWRMECKWSRWRKWGCGGNGKWGIKGLTRGDENKGGSKGR